MKTHFNKSDARFIWLLLLVFLWSNAEADIDEDFGVWGAIQGQGSFVDSGSEMGRWQWWMEGQGRFFNDAAKLGQSIIRPGLGYKLSDNVSIWLGYGWIATWPVGRDPTDEHRIWQQLSWSKPYSWGNLATRTRLEQRFLSNGDDTGWRFRQFIKYTHPLFTERTYLSVWNEVFVNINSTDWGATSGFGQNRIFAGLGVFIDSKRHYRFELGYLNQFIDHKNRTDRMNHLISASLFIRY
jgi:Protein of unknown function (DUF2490)